MAREEAIVARDFLGLGGNGVVRRDGEREWNDMEKGRHSVSSLARLVPPSFNLFHDPETSALGRTRYVIDRSGQSIGAAYSSVDSNRVMGARDNGFGAVVGPGGVPINANALMNGNALRGYAGRPVGNANMAPESISNLGVSGFGETMNSARAGFTAGFNPANIQKSWNQSGNATTATLGEVEMEGGPGILNRSDKEQMIVSGKFQEALIDAEIQQLTREECRHYLKQKGMRHPSWNKAAVMQHVISLKNLQEERVIEKNGQNPTEWSSLQYFHPVQTQERTFNLNYKGMQDNGESGKLGKRENSSNGNHKLESPFAAQARHFGITQMSHVARVPEEQSSSTQPVDKVGVLSNPLLCVTMPNLKHHNLSIPALRAQYGLISGGVPQGPRPMGSVSGPFMTLPAGNQTRPITSNSPERPGNSPGRPGSAQLTIFYAGAVNVYDNIPVEQAQAVMHLARSGSSWSDKMSNPPAAQCVPSTSSMVTSSLSRPASPPPGLAVPLLSTQPTPQKLQNAGQSTSTPQPAAASSQANQNPISASNKPETSRPSTPSTSALLGSQPAVSKALPQARKASLARFLEKRKERVRSKPPYPTKRPSPERTSPQGENLSSTVCGGASLYPPFTVSDECTEEKLGHICSGMEEEMDTCEMDTEGQNWLKTADKQRQTNECDLAIKASPTCQETFR